MKKVILTGATGFVGANLARRLLREGHDLHLLVRPRFRPWRITSIRADVQLHEVDLCDETNLRGVVAAIRPDWVFHVAAHGAYSSQTDPRQIMQTNLIGTMNLVEAALETGFSAFVNTGSSSEYGLKQHAPSETEWLEPNSCYAVSKAAATQYCHFIAQSHGVHMPTLRLYSAYGPYEQPTRLIPTLILRGIAGELPPLVEPAIARDFVYAEDVVEAYLLAATTPDQEPGAIYNVGTGVQTRMRDVVDLARQVFSISDEPRWGSMPNRQWDTSVWVSDSRKIQRVLGWQPRCSLEQGLRLTMDWLRDNQGLQDFYRQIQAAAK